MKFDYQKQKDKKWKYITKGVCECEYDFPVETFCKKLFYKITDTKMIIADKYAWDGPSGPTIDTKNSIFPSLVHDVLYQAIREGDISIDCRKFADKIFYELLKESKMFILRRFLWYIGVRLFGKKHVKIKVS